MLMLDASCFLIHTCAQPRAGQLQAPVSPLLPFLLPHSTSLRWERGTGVAAVTLAAGARVDAVMPQGIGFLEALAVATALSSRMQGSGECMELYGVGSCY